MTREEREKAIDALKISAPFMALTKEEFYDYIQTLNKITNWLEQEPCADAISREKTMQIVRKWFDRDAAPSDLKNEIEQLPPVTPQYTDAEIQKMQDLESVEIQTAYEIGKEEGSSEKPNKRIHHKSEARRWKRRYLDLKQRIFKLEERTRWIPVSERYPEDGQRVLVDYCDEDAGIMLIRFNVNGYHGFKAWMPLPKPYVPDTNVGKKSANPTGAEKLGHWRTDKDNSRH